MTAGSQSQVIVDFVEACKAANLTAKTARRNRKSLSGDNFYARKFTESVLAISTTRKRLGGVIKLCPLDAGDTESLGDSLNAITDEDSSPSDRINALTEVRRICETVLLPSIESMTATPIPATEQVLPNSVVAGTRGYLKKVVQQANGCYEHQWFDACSVMIRRFVETLIIEVYDAKSRAVAIKDSDGNYYMLSRLVDIILADKAFNLGRETKRGLPLLKSLGDRSAHNRYFIAKQADIDKVTGDLRVVAEELLTIAGLGTA